MNTTLKIQEWVVVSRNGAIPVDPVYPVLPVSSGLSLQARNIPFKGQSRRGDHVVLVGNFLLLEAELIDLLDKGELNSDGILKVGIRSA
jgi:hypothetical protein